jgi:putative ABC transport system permease protein
MLRTHLKLALRNFRKYPAFSLINLGGLATGIAASFVLLVYSRREMSCDRHFQDSDKIYRVATDFFNMGGFAKSQPMLRDLLKVSCKDVEYATALDRSYQDVLIRTSEQDRAFTGNYPYYTDPSFFKVFSFQAAAGAIPENGLQPGEIILSETYARKFFGTRDATGKTLLIGKENMPVKVVAVLKEDFQKSHLDPQIVLPLTRDKTADGVVNWSSASFYNYVKLKDNGSEAGLKNWLNRVLEKIVYPASGASAPFAQWKESNTAVKFIVQPLASIYFSSDLKFEISAGGNLTQVKILGGLSIFLILLAIINYVNLVTARYSIRSREIGVKKTFGASRGALAAQMIQESLLFSLLAMILACGLIQVILFIYRWATGTALTGPIPLTVVHYGWLLLFSLCVGLLAGLYPAFYLTAFRPIFSIRAKGKMPGKGNPRVRNTLVLVQFIIAAGLIFVSIVIYGQLQYMKNKDKGFRAEGVVLVENIGDLQNQAPAFQQMVEQQAQVVSTSFCERTPAGKSIWMYTYRTASMKEDMTLQTFPVDDKYIPTLGMRLINGRNFRRDLITDTNSLILNESAVAALGLFDPLGATVNGSERVIGVVKDFNFASLRQKIGPVVLKYSPSGSSLAIRISGGHPAAFLDRLKEIGKGFTHGEPLKLSFLDENFVKLAEKERLLASAISFFTILAILLATGGLIGLTLFNIEQRTKEIGIRKVLGAGIQNILGLVSRDFIRLVALASLIALPLSWWVMNRWLENFAYRVPISIWTFFITESITVTIAMSVICILSFRAAIASPVDNLRAE